MIGLTHNIGKIKSFLVLVLGVLLSACASQNTLLQSPESNSVDSIDQITETLDNALDQETERQVPSIPDSVMAALIPKIGAKNRNNTNPDKSEEPRFDIAVNDLPARDFFAGLVEGTNRNMVVHPGVKGNVSLQLKNVTVSEVLDITKEIFGYEYKEAGRLIKIYPSGLRTKIFAINYLNINRNGESNTRVNSGQITQNSSGNSSSNNTSNSNSNSSGNSNGGNNTRSQGGGSGTEITTSNKNNFWQKLKQTLQLIIGNEAGHSVVVTPSTGMVVVRANSNALSSVKSFLDSAELILKRQVILEAKILEVSLSEGYQQGVDWSFAQASKSLDSGGINPLRGIGLSQIAKKIALTDAGGIFASTIKLGNFDTTISLLGTQGNVQVLSSPRIATVNNQKAVIKVGNDEYFVTDINFQSNNDVNSTSTDIDLTPFFSGIALDVTPQISEDGKIILHVHPTISKVIDQQKVIDIGGQVINLPLAFSTIRESDSVITAENGQIVVIGGLIQNRNKDENSSVPFLGDLPLIGELFKQKGKDAQKTELVILLRATVTDDKAIQDDIRSSRQRFGGFRDRMTGPTETVFNQ